MNKSVFPLDRADTRTVGPVEDGLPVHFEGINFIAVCGWDRQALDNRELVSLELVESIGDLDVLENPLDTVSLT
jgi:hypothetical protein